MEKERSKKIRYGENKKGLMKSCDESNQFSNEDEEHTHFFNEFYIL